MLRRLVKRAVINQITVPHFVTLEQGKLDSLRIPHFHSCRNLIKPYQNLYYDASFGSYEHMKAISY